MLRSVIRFINSISAAPREQKHISKRSKPTLENMIQELRNNIESNTNIDRSIYLAERILIILNGKKIRGEYNE